MFLKKKAARWSGWWYAWALLAYNTAAHATMWGFMLQMRWKSAAVSV